MAGTAFLAVGAFFVAASRGISKSSYGSNVGPAVFPTLLGIILMALSVIVIYAAVTAKGTGKPASGRNYKRLAALIGATIVYIAIFEPLGYVISTFLFLTFVFQLMERKNLVKSLLISAIFSVVVYAAYVVLLQGNLPPFPEFLTNLFARG
ncbi:MAG: tripartite tricarboxylate transporter TctB family protein [Candidatus Krumholzibacteriia bacterium]